MKIAVRMVDDERRRRCLRRRLWRPASSGLSTGGMEEFRARVEFAARMFASGVDRCRGAWRVWRNSARAAELCGLEKAVPLIATLERRLDAALLEGIAPARLKLPSGRMTKVRYERGKPPWVASGCRIFSG